MSSLLLTPSVSTLYVRNGTHQLYFSSSSLKKVRIVRESVGSGPVRVPGEPNRRPGQRPHAGPEPAAGGGEDCRPTTATGPVGARRQQAAVQEPSRVQDGAGGEDSGLLWRRRVVQHRGLRQGIRRGVRRVRRRHAHTRREHTPPGRRRWRHLQQRGYPRGFVRWLSGYGQALGRPTAVR